MWRSISTLILWRAATNKSTYGCCESGPFYSVKTLKKSLLIGLNWFQKCVTSVQSVLNKQVFPQNEFGLLEYTLVKLKQSCFINQNDFFKAFRIFIYIFFFTQRSRSAKHNTVIVPAELFHAFIMLKNCKTQFFFY